MQHQPTYNVAIIIPTLNEEHFITRCLESVLGQTYPTDKMDIMVVDGGSTDNTCAIVREMSCRCANIRLLDNPNRYQSAAFNIGVQASDAPYIIRMDAHATYDSHYIERCVKLLADHTEYGNVGGTLDVLPQNDSLIARANALLNQLKFGIGGAAFRMGATAQAVDTVPFGAFRRQVVEQIGGMREDLARGEDNEYNTRIRKAGYTVWLDPNIRSTYYARATWSSSCKQMYSNGVSIGNLVYIDRNAIGLRHLVPLAFVLALILSLIAACLTSYGWYAFGFIVGAYTLAAIVADIDACSKHGWEYVLILPPLFFSVHVSYGIGTLIGLVRK